MSLPLTPEQLQSLDFGSQDSLRLVDPRSNTAYVLVAEADYEAVREILDDERRQKVIRAVALRNAVDRMEQSP